MERLEYRYRWDRSEHQRFYRALQREARGSKVRLLVLIWIGLLAALSVFAFIRARPEQRSVAALWPVGFFAVYLVFDLWGLAYMNARAYERTHAQCIPNDQVRVLSDEGLAARCTIGDASIRWAGIVRVRETPEFFLFFTTPRCAIQLPKRVVAEPQEVRAWLDRTAEATGLSQLRITAP
jgi:hypothetical protein